MKCLYWNIRGLANSPSRLALKNLITAHKPHIVIISEPWLLFEHFPRHWFHRLRFKLFALNTRNNLDPNLWCLCLNHLTLDVLSITDQQITFSLKDNNITFAISAIYASTNYIHRRQLWQTLTNLQNQYNLPWCSIGDFNTILGSHEHRGTSTPARGPMNDFAEWSNQNYLFHLPTRGVQFTWSSGRSGRRLTERRLDRAIYKQSWLDMCSALNVSTLSRLKSDHFPLLMDFETSTISFASQFKFMNMWSLHADCKNMIQQSWNETVVGCPMFILNQKLKNLKQKLKIWNKTVFGNLNSIVKEAEQKLLYIQDEIDSNGATETLLEHQKMAQISLEHALEIEEEFWREKSNNAWHAQGDRNTKYFHRLANIKHTSKRIDSIKDGENLIIEPDQISSHITNHFQNIFSSNFPVQDLQVDELIDGVIPNMINEDSNHILTMLPTPQEIFQAVCSLKKDSAPGPDGFGASFYQNYWEIVKNDVINAVLEFFTKD